MSHYWINAQCRLYIKRLESICKPFWRLGSIIFLSGGGGANDTFDRIPRFLGKIKVEKSIFTTAIFERLSQIDVFLYFHDNGHPKCCGERCS